MLLTREQAERIESECRAWSVPEVEIIGEGGDLVVVLIDEEGNRVESFTLRPGGEIAT